jgi:hypothetical protein
VLVGLGNWYVLDLMKIVYSHWSAPRFMSMDHRIILAVSVLLARQHYSQIEMVTDYQGAKLFEKMQLPFTSVRTDLEGFDVHPMAWAAGKMKVYSLQEEPFAHVDQDVFLFKALPQKIVEAPLFAQSYEARHLYNVSLSKTPERHVARFTTPASDWDCYNAGILGGHDVEFLRDYALKGLEGIRELDSIHPYTMTVYEQAWLARHARDCGKKVITLFDHNNPSEAEALGYCHLMQCKHSDECVGRVRRRLQKMDPNMFNRAILAG